MRVKSAMFYVDQLLKVADDFAERIDEITKVIRRSNWLSFIVSII